MTPSILKKTGHRGLLLAFFACIAWSSSPASARDDPSGAPIMTEEADSSEAEVSTSAMVVFLTSMTIFVLAIFVGFEVITKVPPTLHTPLMSGANAISGVTLVGAVIAAGYNGVHGEGWFLVALVGLIAVILATINVVGGFMVTGRMLAMFKKR